MLQTKFKKNFRFFKKL